MVDVQETIDILRTVSALNRLDDKSLSALAAAMQPRTLQMGEALYRSGQHGDSMVILGSGRLAVLLSPTKGAPTTEVAVIYPGEVVGEMACVDPAQRSATVVAKEPSVVFELTRTILAAVRTQAPQLSVAIVTAVIRQLTRRIRETNRQIQDHLDGVEAPTPSKTSPPVSLESGASIPLGRIDLKALPCFTGFSNEELQALVKVAPPRTYPSGTILCREGDQAASCYILAQGELEVLRLISAEQRCLARLPAGTMAGQMALVDRALRSATLRTAQQTVVLELGRDSFEAMLASASPFAVRVQEQVAVAGIRQLRAATERLKGLLKESGSKRWRPSRSEAPKDPGKAPSAPLSAQEGSRGAPVAPGTPPRPSSLDIEDGNAEEMTIAYLHAALGEWGMSMDDLDQVRSVRPEGVMSAAERRARHNSV